MIIGLFGAFVPLVPPMPITYTATCTAYTATLDECGKDDGITASGTLAVQGRTVACDDLPLGTVLKVNGKRFIVEDRFGGGHRNRIDFFMNDKEAAFDFGRKQKTFEIEGQYQKMPTENIVCC